MKSGFVAVVGRPNVGKSTLVNALVGSKVSIISPRPQTTRNTIRGVLTLADPPAQVVFVDTPGLHRPKTALGNRLNTLVYGTLADADAVVFVVDATQEIGPGDRLIADRLRRADAAVIVVLNKTDVATRDQITAQLGKAGEWDFDAYVPISAREGAGLGAVLEEIVGRLPEGPAYFPPDMVTDQPEDQLISEIVREKFLARLRDELPHSLVVQVVSKEERPNGVLYVQARLIVERSSQKGIVIGAGGELIRDAGSEARAELEGVLGTRIFLDLKARVEKEWQRRESSLDRLGF